MSSEDLSSRYASSASSWRGDAASSSPWSAPRRSSIRTSKPETIDAIAGRPSHPARVRSPRATAEGADSSSGDATDMEACVQQPRRSSDTAVKHTPDPMLSIPRPQTRAECQQEARPCPWVGCRHHLLLEVALAGGSRHRATSLRLNIRSSTGGRRPGLRSSAAAALVQVWIDDAIDQLVTMEHTCALDVVDEHPGGLPASRVAKLLAVSKQWTEQEERRPRVQGALSELREYLDDDS